jgi:putative peptidoglycan lipid II flippase
VLFERGAFTAADTAATAQALTAFAAGLPAFVLLKVFQAAYFAREDTKTPMRWTIVNLVVNVAGSIGLFFLFQHLGLMPHVGIALATSIAGWINAIGLWLGLSRRGDFEADRRVVRNVPLILLASIGMGAALVAAQSWLAPGLAASATLPVRLAALGALVTAGLVVFGALILATGVMSPVQLKRFTGRGKR